MSTENAREEVLLRLMAAVQSVDRTTYDLGLYKDSARSTPEVVRQCVMAIAVASRALDDLIARLATLEHPDQAKQVFENLAALFRQEAESDQLAPALAIMLGIAPDSTITRGFELLVIFLEGVQDGTRLQVIKALQAALETWGI
jgi:hypothetical protein